MDIDQTRKQRTQAADGHEPAIDPAGRFSSCADLPRQDQFGIFFCRQAKLIFEVFWQPIPDIFENSLDTQPGCRAAHVIPADALTGQRADCIDQDRFACASFTRNDKQP
jgi:hypothetical protein